MTCTVLRFVETGPGFVSFLMQDIWTKRLPRKNNSGSVDTNHDRKIMTLDGVAIGRCTLTVDTYFDFLVRAMLRRKRLDNQKILSRGLKF